MHRAGMVLGIVVGMLAATAAAADSPVARDARVGGDLKRTRFVADLSKAVDFRAFLLADPYRVIIDLPEVKFQMPEGLGVRGRGLVSAYRFGLFAPGKSRIVIDLTEPSIVDKAFVLDPADGQPARLVIDLKRTTHDGFMAKLREAPEPPQDAGPSAQAQPGEAKGNKPLIVIDPGHGGIDGGAVGANGALEKNVAFDFALALKAKLEKTGRFKVVMTRSMDIFIPLAERVEMARANTADLLISLHADALDPKHPLLNAKMVQEVRGATIYTLSDRASDAESKAIAARENRSDILAGVVETAAGDDDLANILIDLIQRETKNLSIGFAKTLLSHLEGKIPLNSKPHRFANFRVLKAPDVPSVLFELGFLSQQEDEKAMTSPEWRAQVTDLVAQSVDMFFAKREVRVPF